MAMDLKDYIEKKNLARILQAGMSVGPAGYNLAGNVAKLNAVGTIGSAGLYVAFPDLIERYKAEAPMAMKANPDAVLQIGGYDNQRTIVENINAEAIKRSIKKAQMISGNAGLISVNVMDAIWDTDCHVIAACEGGADIVTVGAGLPMGLPKTVANFPDIKLIPILSEYRGVKIILKKWIKQNKLPFAISIEHPKYAAGHLGAPKLDFDNPTYGFERVYEDCQEVFRELGCGQIPLIAAGSGGTDRERFDQLINYGYDCVQMGTIFAVSQEGDAHENFKNILLEAKPEDIVTFMSCAGLPCRGVKTPWLIKYLAREEKMRAKATPEKARCHNTINNEAKGYEAACLKHCGYREGNGRAGQFCISNQLFHAYFGNVKQGLFFRGSEPLPFDYSPSVQEIFDYFLK